MTRLLFVYGTLRPTLAPAAVRDIVNGFRPLGPATVRGTLYDLGRYPGVVLDEAGGVVHGELFEIAADAAHVEAALRRLNRYEGFDPARPATGGFCRVTCVPRTDTGDGPTAWVYVYNRPVDPARRIADGRWPPAPSPGTAGRGSG